jgi:hypothetical protein
MKYDGKLTDSEIFIMPIQPINEHRFVPNRIVRMLLDTHPSADMNTIAMMEFTDQERMQFAQLIGYSLGGFGELDYVDDETYDSASTMEQLGVTEQKARNITLRAQIQRVKDGMKEAVSVLYRIHPDDLEV